MNKKETYLKNIEDLLGLLKQRYDQEVLSQVYFCTLTLIENLYGVNSIKIRALSESGAKTRFDAAPWADDVRKAFKDFLVGILNGIKNDIENDLIFNLEKQTIGSVVADFITLAKSSAEEGYKDVAAVLAAASIEDALKRFSALNELQVDDKVMSEVVNALKTKGLLKGPQASLLASYTQIRNKAFHAQWDKIEMSDVKSLISFTEEFILKNLS